MRAGIRVAPAGPQTPGTDLAVVDLRTDWWREFWLRSKFDGVDTYSLDVYDNEADARAEAHRLGSATHPATGYSGAEITITPDGGALFNVSPMKVTVRADGVTPDTIICWTHNPAGLLVDRIALLLKQYVASHEMLARFGVHVGHQLPGKILQAVGVTSGMFSLEGQVQQYEQGALQLGLHAWVARLNNADAYRDCLAAGSGLIAIAEEQRTWGGMAADTQVLSQPMIAQEMNDGGGEVYHALVALRIRFPDLVGTRQASSDEFGTGGVYAESLNP